MYIPWLQDWPIESNWTIKFHAYSCVKNDQQIQVTCLTSGAAPRAPKPSARLTLALAMKACSQWPFSHWNFWIWSAALIREVEIMQGKVCEHLRNKICYNLLLENSELCVETCWKLILSCRNLWTSFNIFQNSSASSSPPPSSTCPDSDSPELVESPLKFKLLHVLKVAKLRRAMTHSLDSLPWKVFVILVEICWDDPHMATRDFFV